MAEAPSFFDSELVGAALRAIGALVGLIALGAFAIWFQRRQRGGERRIRIQERLMLNRGSSIVLLDVDGRRLLVGITPEAIRLITPMESAFEQALDSVADDAMPGLESIAEVRS